MRAILAGDDALGGRVGIVEETGAFHHLGERVTEGEAEALAEALVETRLQRVIPTETNRIGRPDGSEVRIGPE